MWSSTRSTGSVTSDCTLSSVQRSVLNTAAVLEDLEGSEEYEYSRLLPILLEMERDSPGELCVRQFLAENCELSSSVLDSLPFLRQVESHDFELTAGMRDTKLFRDFLNVLQEMVVSDTTGQKQFHHIAVEGKDGKTALAPLDACQTCAVQLCVERFEANFSQEEWETVLRVAFRGCGLELDYAKWIACCRRTLRLARLIITLCLAE
ncbi:unnamed protein product [Effrenium voratum]|uniref:Uncharacterized protein n=1 Tax=Effrenium voratum TaxID=2562239 RepID=A0AA36IWC0_9DINO|nr:unnamed protein product [Effrenium voratum]